MHKQEIEEAGRGAGVSPETWLRRYHATTAHAELVCFPHAGGAAGFWRPLADAVGDALDVRAVQYPGRLDRFREAPLDDLHRLADLVAEALAAGPAPAGPRVLLGHSMGASLAREVALRLSDVPGHGAAALIASGRRAPSRPGSGWPETDEALLARVRELGGTDPAVLADPELLDVILPALRADYAAVARYVPGGGLLSCPVVALTGDADPEVTAEDVAPWRETTTGPFAMRVLPGGHFFLNDHLPTVAELAVSLSAAAERGRLSR
ncbi:thioesterase II family protein [Streptomyces sp. NPDC086838]|uniref:thioesterase II family protein n=1 Tax=Streptomyces sp. NPDC086838 TaxID=3365762 RepID=UPI0038039AFB